MPTRQEVLQHAHTTPGFFPTAEADALHDVARRAVFTGTGALIEIGAYLGRSTLIIAAALCDQVATRQAMLFSIDHHRGSTEMQSGQYHDAALVDPESGQMDSLPQWRTAIANAGVESLVIAVIGDSAVVAKYWRQPVSFVLIDGGHAEAVTWADYRGWAPLVAPGGSLVFHDVFENPLDGGQPPFACYRDALKSGVFSEDEAAGCGSLRVLIRR